MTWQIVWMFFLSARRPESRTGDCRIDAVARRVLPALLLIMLAACASNSSNDLGLEEPLIINGLSIENRTRAFITAARLMVPATGNFVSCGNIPPGKVCATGFPEAEYTGNEVELTWSQSGQIFSTGPLTVRPSEEVIEAGFTQVVITVVGPNSAGVKLVESRQADLR